MIFINFMEKGQHYKNEKHTVNRKDSTDIERNDLWGRN